MDAKEIFEELRKIDDKLSSLSIILAKNTVILEDHKMRSDRSERRLELLENDVNKLRGFFSVGGWILGILATAITLISKAYILLK